MRHKLDGGGNTSFWHDRWCTRISLKILFLEAFKLARNKEAFVRDYWGRLRWRIQTNEYVMVG